MRIEVPHLTLASYRVCVPRTAPFLVLTLHERCSCVCFDRTCVLLDLDPPTDASTKRCSTTDP
jgi:hypothetical protein